MTEKTRPATLLAAFTAHPASVNETYAQHAGFAFGFALRLFGAGFAALAHAILPFAFETTAGRMIRKMCARMDNRMDAPVDHRSGPHDTIIDVPAGPAPQMDRRV